MADTDTCRDDDQKKTIIEYKEMKEPPTIGSKFISYQLDLIPKTVIKLKSVVMKGYKIIRIID